MSRHRTDLRVDGAVDEFDGFVDEDVDEGYHDYDDADQPPIDDRGRSSRTPSSSVRSMRSHRSHHTLKSHRSHRSHHSNATGPGDHSSRRKVRNRNRPPSQRTPRKLAEEVEPEDGLGGAGDGGDGDSGSHTKRHRRRRRHRGDGDGDGAAADAGAEVGLDDIPVDLGVAADDSSGTHHADSDGSRRKHRDRRQRRHRTRSGDGDAEPSGRGHRSERLVPALSPISTVSGGTQDGDGEGDDSAGDHDASPRHGGRSSSRRARRHHRRVIEDLGASADVDDASHGGGGDVGGNKARRSPRREAQPSGSRRRRRRHQHPRSDDGGAGAGEDNTGAYHEAYIDVADDVAAADGVDDSYDIDGGASDGAVDAAADATRTSGGTGGTGSDSRGHPRRGRRGRGSGSGSGSGSGAGAGAGGRSTGRDSGSSSRRRRHGGAEALRGDSDGASGAGSSRRRAMQRSESARSPVPRLASPAQVAMVEAAARNSLPRRDGGAGVSGRSRGPVEPALPLHERVGIDGTLTPEPEEGSAAAAALSRELDLNERKRHRPKVVKLIVDGREKTAKKEKVKKQGKEIDEEHALYHLSYGMMFGISNTLRKYGKRQDLVMSHFMHVHKYEFLPKKGHILNHTFKFKDYCPEVFRHLRERFGISDSDYLESFSGKYNFIEFISNSKSGQFFFYSHNGRLMIKTQSDVESKFLRRIMPHYYRYVMKNPHTFITRFYGMHRLKMNYLGRKLHFVVMQSVFEGDQAIHETYDLKGSTHGRAATEKEKARGPAKCVFKDLDMLERVERLGKLKFGGDRSKFLQQIERDVAFLERMKIMDYSLLIGIHYKSRSRETGLRRRSVQLSPDAKWDHMAQLRALREMHAKNQLKDVGETDEGTDDDTDARPGSRRGSRSGGPLRPTASVPAMVRSPHKRGGSRDIFTRADDLCIKGNNPDGSYCDEVYHMGIIDILQQYDTKKSLETIFKSFVTKKSTISSVNPTQYGDRFKEFMAQITE